MTPLGALTSSLLIPFSLCCFRVLMHCLSSLVRCDHDVAISCAHTCSGGDRDVCGAAVRELEGAVGAWPPHAHGAGSGRPCGAGA